MTALTAPSIQPPPRPCRGPTGCVPGGLRPRRAVGRPRAAQHRRGRLALQPGRRSRARRLRACHAAGRPTIWSTAPKPIPAGARGDRRGRGRPGRGRRRGSTAAWSTSSCPTPPGPPRRRAWAAWPTSPTAPIGWARSPAAGGALDRPVPAAQRRVHVRSGRPRRAPRRGRSTGPWWWSTGTTPGRRRRPSPASWSSLGEDAEVTVVEHHGGDDVAVARGAGDRARRRAGRAVALPQRAAARAEHVADRLAALAGGARRDAGGRAGRARRRLRPHAGRLPARRPRGDRQPDGGLLRRGRADARLPHVPGPRRARHHLEPAVQGSGGRQLAVGLHRPHPGAARGPRHQRASRPTGRSS